MNVLPKPIENLIDALTRFPGIGPKSAARIALFILKTPPSYTDNLITLLQDIKDIKTCATCYNFSESDKCKICSSKQRDAHTIMVVEDALDLLAIEQAGIFNGVYHVLGGVISPMNGVGPDEIRIKELFNRLKNIDGKVEIIMATNPNMEGEATALYIKNEILNDDLLRDKVKISSLARGLSTGSDIDYIDPVTLQKAFRGRVDF